jgi:hypothetical protein
MAIGECPECKKSVSTGASACPHCGYKPRGCLAKSFVGVLAAIIILCGLAVVGSLIGNKKPDPSPPPTPAQAKAAEACRAKLETARQGGALHDLDWTPGEMPLVVVGPAFEQFPMEAKQGFAATVNCFLMGGKAEYIQFDVVEYLNHRVVGTWSLGRFKAKE